MPVAKDVFLPYLQKIDLDEDSKDYLFSYFDDDSNEFSIDGLLEFLEPMMTGLDSVDINNLCSELSRLFNTNRHNNEDNGERKLSESLQIGLSTVYETVQIGGKVGDIRHTMSNRGPERSLVDQRKLRNAERKIEEKRKARGTYNGEIIPEWNPSQAPQMVVNQAKKNLTGDSRSKDIKLEDFDIQFAGKLHLILGRKILQNANMLLANGRRYGLVGKNGIGKSTLLRAIAKRELEVPSHIRILHVEQEIAGDDTTALVSVLTADDERESLLAEEKSLNQILNNPYASIEESNESSVRLKQVYAKLEEIEADKAESKASAILNGLGFSPAQQQAATKTFSGGWVKLF